MHIKKEMFRLALPIAFQQFMIALVGASDAVMLGKLSQNAMSAVSLATQVTFVFNLFMAAFVIGENMFIAQYHGKKDFQNISRIFLLVMKISVLTAVLFWFFTFFFPDKIMSFLTNDTELIALGSIYLKVIGVSYPLSAAAQVCMTVMKNCGAVNMVTIISSITVILNIFLNAVLIFGMFGLPVLGIQGAAIATIFATAVQTIWSFCYIILKLKKVDLRLISCSNDLKINFFRKTMPVLLNELAWGGGFTMYSVILGHLGTDAVAANGIANISKNLIICFCSGLASAGSIIIGNLLGANAFEEAKDAGRILVRFSILCGVISGGVLLLLSPVILRWTDLSAQAQYDLQIMLMISSYYLVGKSVNSMTVGGIFPAGGDSKFGMICDAVTLWCITVPLGYLCAFVWKLPVLLVYFVLNLDEIIKLPAVWHHYRKFTWLKNIT